MRIFGVRDPDHKYAFRPGVYGLLIKEDKVGVIYSPLGYFLIGGGIESGETDTECLIREGLEEAGCLLSVGSHLETVDEFVVVPGSEVGQHKRIIAYKAEISECGHASIEADHELLWLDKQTAVEKMYLKGQAYLINKYL